MRARGLARIWRQPPKLQVAGSNPAAPAVQMKLGEIEREIEKVVELIRKGYQRDFIKGRIGNVYFSKDKILEIAKCRIKARKKFGRMAEKLFFDEEGLRYATPPEIADYRAKRLNGNAIADICCGVGLQLIYFSKYSKKAIGVEVDRMRAKLAKLNMLAMNIKNVEIIEGDALKIFNKIDADCIFCDPSRKPEEKERKFESLVPNPLKVYEIYRKKTDKIAFELPPQIRKEKIKIEGEKEYTSLNFDLNRLALYTGSLANCHTSAVSLPTGERITNEDEKMEIKKSEELHDFLYEVDRTIIKAGLLENLAGKIGFEGNLLQLKERRTLLTSPLLYASAFLKPYKVIEKCDFELNLINKILKRLNARKATLRFSIEPENYWRIRKRIEDGLNGDRSFYIFRVGGKAVVAERY